MKFWKKALLSQVLFGFMGMGPGYANPYGIVDSAKNLASNVWDDPSLLVGVAAVGAGTTGALSGGLGAASVPVGNYIIERWKAKNQQKNIEEEARQKADINFRTEQRTKNILNILHRPPKDFSQDSRISLDEDLSAPKESRHFFSLGLSHEQKLHNAALDLVISHSQVIDGLEKEYTKKSQELSHLVQAKLLSDEKENAKREELKTLKKVIKYHRDFIKTGGKKALDHKNKSKSKESAFNIFKWRSEHILDNVLAENNLDPAKVYTIKGDEQPTLKRRILKGPVTEKLKDRRKHQATLRAGSTKK